MTISAAQARYLFAYFNPHEREARDGFVRRRLGMWNEYFNPHEREARDRPSRA